MGKFNIKAIGKNALNSLKTDGVNIAVTTASVVATQKFLDFKTLFPNVDPKKWFIDHEGLVKIGGVIVTLAIFNKMPMWAKCLLYGVAIQGGIKAVRRYTMNDAGKAFVDQIGSGSYDDQINAMANEIKSAAGVGLDGITDNNYSAVSGIGSSSEINPSVSLMNNSATGVSGIGMEDDYLYN